MSARPLRRDDENHIVYVDFHKPLPDHDRHWAATLAVLIALSWTLALAAFAWMVTP